MCGQLLPVHIHTRAHARTHTHTHTRTRTHARMHTHTHTHTHTPNVSYSLLQHTCTAFYSSRLAEMDNGRQQCPNPLGLFGRDAQLFDSSNSVIPLLGPVLMLWVTLWYPMTRINIQLTRRNNIDDNSQNMAKISLQKKRTAQQYRNKIINTPPLVVSPDYQNDTKTEQTTDSKLEIRELFFNLCDEGSHLNGKTKRVDDHHQIKDQEATYKDILYLIHLLSCK